MSNDLYTPVLVLVGVLGSAWLTYQGTTYRYRTKPKDPTSELFSYYDQMLKNVWEQNREKDKLIDKLEASLDNIQKELWETKELLIEAKQQLKMATKQGEVVQQHIVDARIALDNSSRQT